MLHRNNWANAQLVFVMVTLMFATAANAALVDCTTHVGVDSLPDTECLQSGDSVNKIPALAVQDIALTVPSSSAQPRLQIDQAHHSGAMSNSLPLLILIGLSLAVLLVRAKRFNTK